MIVLIVIAILHTVGVVLNILGMYLFNRKLDATFGGNKRKLIETRGDLVEFLMNFVIPYIGFAVSIGSIREIESSTPRGIEKRIGRREYWNEKIW